MGEYSFNKILAQLIKDELKKKGLTAYIVNRLTDGNGTGMTADIRAVNKYETDCIVELHCNAYNNVAKGCETLYWHTSEKGKQLAGFVQNEMLKALGNADRGLKPINSKGRGAAVLRGSYAPMIMTEPFFIDNPQEFSNATNKIDALGRGIAKGIINFLTKGK